MKIALVIFEMKNPFKIGLVIKKLKITRQPTGFYVKNSNERIKNEGCFFCATTLLLSNYNITAVVCVCVRGDYTITCKPWKIS
jgi:hypothetical protein